MQPALYYPYIHIRSENWLKATLLCVPAVKRIVPENYATGGRCGDHPIRHNLGRTASTQAVPAATAARWPRNIAS